MKAMVFAAGLGSRLGEITQSLPKCLVDIGGQTILAHVLQQIARSGIREICINLHHHGEQIADYLKDHDNFGLRVEFSRETSLLETGGGLKKAASFFEGSEPFLLHNSDVYSDVDLSSMIAAHNHSHPLATLAVMDRSSSRRLLFDEKEELVGWENREKPARELVRNAGEVHALAFSGIHVVSPKLFDYMKDETGAFSITRTYFAAAKAGEVIRGFRMDSSFWLDVGTPERLASLREKIRAGRM